MEKGVEKNNMAKEEKEKKMYKCKWPGCDAEFERTIDLARHVRLEHKGKGKVPERVKEQKVVELAGEEARVEGKSEEKKKGAIELEAGVVKIKEEGNIAVSTPPPERIDVTGRGIPVGSKTRIQPPPIDIEVTNYNKVKETEKKYEPLLLSYPEVTGVGVGRTADGRPAIEILVCKKCPEHEDIPKSLDGVPVIIHEVGEAKAVAPPAGEKGQEQERKETLIDKLAHAKKLGVFFEGPVRKSLRKWLMRRREGKTGGEKK